MKNLYSIFNINIPFIFDKEKYFNTMIAWKNHKFFLNNEKKKTLTKNYIALNYVRQMNLDTTIDIEKELVNNIKNISVFKRSIPIFKYRLNDFYKAYHDYIEFNEKLKEVKNKIKKYKDEKKALKEKERKKQENEIDCIIDESIIKGFTFIFDKEKVDNPIYHAVLYNLQEAFWNVVVIGGLMLNLPLSAYLLKKSLSKNIVTTENNPLIIKDQNIGKNIINNYFFKNEIDNLLTSNNIQIEKSIIINNGNLLYALHAFTLILKANKIEKNKWNIHVEIIDKYDFTDIKKIKEYVSPKIKVSTILSTTLNNAAIVSSAYGVIKPFYFKIIIDDINYSKGINL